MLLTLSMPVVLTDLHHPVEEREIHIVKEAGHSLLVLRDLQQV